MKRIVFIPLLIILGACSLKIVSKIEKNLPPGEDKQEVVVFELNEKLPEGAEFIGKIDIDQHALTVKCSYPDEINAAKVVARRAGGNAIKIIEHILPDETVCHKIKVEIYKIESESLHVNTDTNFSLIHVFRHRGPGFIVSYNLYLDDSVMCRVTNKFKETIKVKQEGKVTIWAKTESSRALEINLQKGKEYYIRCGITWGFFVGRPTLELLSVESGKAEYDALNTDSKKRSLGETEPVGDDVYR